MSRLSNSWIEAHYPTRCAPPLERVRIGTGCSRRVHRDAVPIFHALGLAFDMFGYTVDSCGVYNCRKIKGSTKWSSHSWAIPTDVNPRRNPWGPWVGGKLVTDLPDELIRYIEHDLVTVDAGLPVVFWGGRWNRPDPMHFQSIASPAEIAGGINSPEGVSMSRYFFAGDTGPHVGEVQARLVATGRNIGTWGPAGDGIDEDSGNPDGSGDTMAALADYQRTAGVAEYVKKPEGWIEQPAGIYAGPRTWAALGLGPKGETGSRGADGAAGSQGPAGPQGREGPVGPRGPQPTSANFGYDEGSSP